MKDFGNKIDDYLKDKLSELERDLFEQEMEKDPEKKKLVEEHQEAIRLIKVAALKQRLDELESSISEEDQQDKKSRIIPLFSNSQMMGIAASLIVLIAVAIWVFLPQQQSQTQFAFREYYQKDPGLPTTMGVSDDISIDHAMILYKQGEYADAEEAFDKLIANNPSDTVFYYKAMTLIERKKYSQAEKILRNDQLKEGKFNQRSEWYLALTLLKQDQKEEAMLILQDITVTDKHVYTKEANSLLVGLEE